MPSFIIKFESFNKIKQSEKCSHQLLKSTKGAMSLEKCSVFQKEDETGGSHRWMAVMHLEAELQPALVTAPGLPGHSEEIPTSRSPMSARPHLPPRPRLHLCSFCLLITASCSPPRGLCACYFSANTSAPRSF